MAKESYIVVNKKKIARDKHLAGGKAHNLATLSRAGFPVPEFFIISTELSEKPPSRKRLKKHIVERLLDFELKKNQRIVARSSSPLEDQQSHSFAGLYESYLNLESAEDVVHAVEKIWHSADSESVSDYSKNIGAGHKHSIAVIVQKMVHATVSGVLFTMHPIESNPEHMLLELVDGDCRHLVSGETTPISIQVNKNDLSFDLAKRAKLSDAMQNFISHSSGLASLLSHGVKIEKLFQSPQDIEWAFDGRQLWILQSRPISSVQQNNPAVFTDKTGTKWSSYFFAERFMQPLSPLGWSYLRPIIRKTALQDPLYFLGYDNKARTVQLKLIDGLPFTNLESYQKLYSHIPLNFISIDKKQTLELDAKTQRRIGLKNIVAIATRLLPYDVGWCPPINLWHWRRFSRAMQNQTNAAFCRFKAENVQDYVDQFEKTRLWSLAFLKIHRWSITFADIFYSLLVKYIDMLGVDDHSNIEKLLGGLPDNATVNANMALIHLDVSNKESFEQFVSQFGHRSESLDIAGKTWGEDSEHIIAMSESLKKVRTELIQKRKQNIADRHSATNQLRQALFDRSIAGKLHVWLLDFILKYAQKFTMLRENQRHLWHKILRIARYSALGIGNELSKSGIIDDPNDVFYLKHQELFLLMTNADMLPNAKKLIHHRQQNHKVLRQKNQFDGKNVNRHEDSNTFRGIGVSAGTVRGRVRIARTYAEAMGGKTGEVLVVPSADPAWSPIFGVVSALVMERGGVLSHASIVAREFRLPTITSLSNATQHLRHGDLVEVDGTHGVLTVISE